ncbi:MAG: flagellar protein FlgN [Clostridiales bacterium]|nr:flagellar protein FlgN [Clostridiales bacterium]
MASLVEELVKILDEEKKVYQTLIEYGEKKRDVLIKVDVPGLEEITGKEQLAGDELIALSNRQLQALTDIATVMGQTEGQMTVTKLIESLGNQPDVQQKLKEARDSLLEAANQMRAINDENAILINQAIELNEYDLTLFRSMRQAPETANYDKSALNTGSILGSSGFDASS